MTVTNADCHESAACPNDDFTKCVCPNDNAGASGTYEGDFFAYTCAGDCTYDSVSLVFLSTTSISDGFIVR